MRRLLGIFRKLTVVLRGKFLVQSAGFGLLWRVIIYILTGQVDCMVKVVGRVDLLEVCIVVKVAALRPIGF